jgi:hypothetical protein
MAGIIVALLAIGMLLDGFFGLIAYSLTELLVGLTLAQSSSGLISRIICMIIFIGVHS